MKRALPLLPLLAATLFACADEAAADKPFVDPDSSLHALKSDRISNYWTDIRGDLPVGEVISESIDFPSYYFGRTATLSAGQRLQVDLLASRKSLVRLYGPATGEVDGEPVFGAALVKADTTRDGGTHVSSFAFDVPADGVYMLVYGPKNVWQADYVIELSCLEGCRPADACLFDAACDPGEFCGNNGVRCIAYPCDASYDVCQAKRELGASCTRDGECMDGLTCTGDVCTGGAVPLGGACKLHEECDNGFCGCADQTCATSICKAYAKEGERCGGFRMAHLVEHCSPGFDCVAPYDIIADIPGHCGDFTTVAEVLAAPERFDGRYIAIKGLVDPNAAMCTKIACSAESPCCNACNANLRVYDDKAQLGTEGIYLAEGGDWLGCAGNECGWRDQCELTPGNMWVAGWFRLDGGVTPVLELGPRYSY